MDGDRILNLTTSEPCESKRLNQSPYYTVTPNAARQHGELRLTSYGRWSGQIHRTRPLRSTSAGLCLEEQDNPPIHTGYFYTGNANTLIFIVDVGNTVNSFVICSKVHWNMVVPPGNMTCTNKFSRMSTSHFMRLWKVVSCTSLAES